MKANTVNTHYAKTHLSALLKKVAEGEEFTIAKAGKPVARLIGIAEKSPRPLGTAKGDFIVPDDFDEPLPDEVLRDFQE